MGEERVWVLMAKCKAGEASKAEIAEMNDLLASSKNNLGNEVLDTVWQSPLQFLPEMKPSEALWQKVETAIDQPKNKKFHIPKTIVAWAVAAALTALTVGVFFVNEKQPSSNAIVEKTGDTKPTPKTHLVLPDGTQVWLNANSHIRYTAADFSKKFREISLIGEAFFDVTKDAAHPFIIHAADVNITVKGTAFNVKAYPTQKHVETSLIRGLVEITTQRDPERKILLRPDEKIVIASNRDTEVAGKNADASLFTISRLQKDANNMAPEMVWMNASLSFDNEALEDLVPKLESWFSITLHVEDKALKQKRFSGMITKETLKQTLEALKLSTPFNYTINNDEVWLNSNH